MKTKIFLILVLLTGTGFSAFAAADSLGLPGDNLDLYGVLELFKKSDNPKDFEKKINDKDSHVNNLDLNGDGKVDYIRVVDNTDNDAHALVLRDPVNENETQDLAVIEIEKKGDKQAQLQAVGDSEIYGANYIIEPGDKKSQEKNDEGKFLDYKKQEIVFVNVWAWPCVEYMYYPDYIVWVSPWYWSYWPGWWYPWEPYPWDVYYVWVYPYHDYYYVTYDYSCQNAQNIYAPRRVVSSSVQDKYREQHARFATSPQKRARDERRVPPTQVTKEGERTAPREQEKNVPRKSRRQGKERTPSEQKSPKERKSVPVEKPTPAPRVPKQNPPRENPVPQPKPVPQPRPRTQPMPVPRNIPPVVPHPVPRPRRPRW